MATTYTITYNVTPSSAGYWKGVSSPQQISTPQYYNLNFYYVYQRYDRNKYCLYLDGNKVSEATAIANDGYSFQGLSISGCTDEKISGNVVVTASFKKNGFNIIYYPNLSGYDCGYEYGVTSPHVLKSYSSFKWEVANYTFNSWNTKADGSGTNYKPGNKVYGSNNSNFYLYAQWTPKNYRITFSHNAGGTTDPTGSNSWPYLSKHTVYGEPNDYYYYLDHWEVTGYDDGSTKTWSPDSGNSFNFTVYGNRTIKAIFDKKSFNLSVVASPSKGGTVGGGGTYVYGTYNNIFATANLGYKFDHWDGTDGGYGTGASRNVKIINDTTYTATFIPKTYTVKLNINGGKWLEEEPESTFISGNNVKTFDTPIQLVSNIPYRFGYKFSGWGWRKDNTGDFTYIYSNGGIFNDDPYKALSGISTQITLYAVWTPIANTIRYHYYTGDTENDKEIIELSTYTIETPNPYKYYDPENERGENSTFLGWSRVKPDSWGVASQEGHGNYPIPINIPVLYELPYTVSISNIKDTTQDNSQWGTTVDVYGFWTVTGKYININGSWKKVNTAYIRTDAGWKVITDMYVKTDDGWKHEVKI